ncbi:transglutaminase domain-containing protein [Endozoicomonas sp. GU-1]|uniref:transglutaminase-like domain-containing protein n=1 Tax=Endozoicomonas sp. GU-1 TaxID=3009078 RepID=UPI0022B58EA2|nr:transglutaminase domain-containing protein [Endozoicomonas sp. GU-1]WBA81030.1 PhoH family protein [Endozoicomonas sp. GU-1]
MFTIHPGAVGFGQNYHSPASDHSVVTAQKRLADSTDNLPQFSEIRNVTPITDCARYLKQSAPPVGDAFHLFDSGDKKDKLIRFYRQKTGNGFLFVIRHPDDLDHHPLRRLHYYPVPGRKTEHPGLIYQSLPITLIFDCDNLRPRQLASLNELLENPPRLDGRPISTTVSRVVLAKTYLIHQPDAPGPDFWRRIFALNGPSSAPFNSSGPNHEAVVRSVSHRTEPPEPGSLQIHCAGQDIFARLFGNLTINRAGEQYFRKGMIDSQPEPVTLCLVDPPDAGSRFWQHLSDILEQGYFIANGERVRLPASLVLQQYHTPTAHIRAFKQAVTSTPVLPEKSCGIINTHNFDAIFSDLSAQENTLQQTDTFQKMASEFDQLFITGELTDQQWRVLKQRAESLPVPPRLVTGALPRPSGERAVRLYTDNVTHIASNAHRYHLAKGQQWEELWFTSKLKLCGKLSFRLGHSPLLLRLLAGEPVVLTGLEHTPVLAGHLESLLAPEPYLWIYGQKIALPNGQLHIVWPGHRLLDQSFWYQRWQQQDAGDRQSTRRAEPAQSIIAGHPGATERLSRLLKSIRLLPLSPNKSYPVIPVQAPSEFLALLEAQLHIEQRLDRAETLDLFHWRKALNKLLAHPVRGDFVIYSFVKAQISARFPDHLAGVDRDGIAAILETMPAQQGPQGLLANFWPLARYMTPALADCLPATLQERPADGCIVRMAAVIKAIFTEEGIKAHHLSVRDGNIQPCHGHRLRLLYDALLAFARDSHHRGLPVHQQAMVLNHQLSAITQCHPSEPTPQLQQHLHQQLQRYFPEQLLTTSLSTLATEWLQASHGHKQQQARRLEQLIAMLDKHKIIELTGPAGTGKSCLALATGQAMQKLQHASKHWLVAAIGAQLGQQAVTTLTLGPNTTWEYLYGSVTLKKNWLGHLASHSLPGQLTDWAKSSEPGLLVINEANLVPQGLLSPLSGLLESPPRLCVNGQTIGLTEKHRVLLTGNPENYPGRHLDPELKSRILNLYYRPLPQSILKEAIIAPLMPDGWPMAVRSTASATILSLLAEYKKLLSKDYELTPRDLNDIMARFSMLTVGATCPASNEQIFALATEACRQSLGGRIDQDRRSEWQALRAYWCSGGRADDQVLDRHQQAFQQFFSQLTEVNQKRPKPLVINTPATRDYIKTCWQFLQLREPGRVAMVVEGAAGWGKDALLLLTLSTWQQQTGKGFQHLNGTPDRFNQFVQAFNRAWRLGEVLVVSELNIIPSGALEEFLNDRLPLPHKDGFKLIGTVNPPTYPGRTAFPPSLTSRFTGVHIHHDTRDDYRLRLQAMGVSEELSRWLTACAHGINDNLRQQRLTLELTLPQLLQVADRLTRISMGQLPKYLRREWRPYLDSCQPKFEWPCIPGQSAEKESSKDSASPETFSLGRPPGVFKEYYVTRFFPGQWRTTLYRLKLHTVSVTTDQNLVESPLPERPVDQSFLLPMLAGRSDLKSGETPGRLILRPGSKWQPLPSLTPANLLTGLRTIPAEAPLELAQDNQTGQYFVRSRLTEPVAVDFIIKPDPKYFESLTAADLIETQPRRCPSLIKVHLDQEVFSQQPGHFPGYQKLREIGQIRNLSERLLVLIDWFRAFSYDHNFVETGISLVKRLLQEQQGSCRHRAFLFQLLCLYWGIEARIIQSESHSFVEVRSRNGWRLCNLSGISRTVRYSSEPKWEDIYTSVPTPPVKSTVGQATGSHASGWNRLLSLVISLCQQWQCSKFALPQEANSLVKDAVLEEFRKNFRPIPMSRHLSARSYYTSSEHRPLITAFDIAYHLAPEQYLLAARHAIDHFGTLAPPERKAIIDWSHCMLIWSKNYQSPKQHDFCRWSEFAWQLYLQSPNDFPVLPVQSMQAVTRFNLDHDGTAQRLDQRLFRVESIDRTWLKNVRDSPEADNFSLLYDSETLPQMAVTDVYWSHSSRGRPDLARLIRGEPCFPEKSTSYLETNTLMLSSQFLIDRAMDALKLATNRQTGALFRDELPYQPDTFLIDYIDHAEQNRQLIRLISDQRSAEIYTPVICKDLEKFRVLIVGNFCDQVTIFESPAGQNFNLIGSGIFSPGIALDCQESLRKIKRLINEPDATTLFNRK